MSLDLAYTESGAGAPMLVLHGLFGSARNWGTIARKLGMDRRVLAVDIRNHGQSPWSERMDYPSMADDVARLVERHRLDPCPVLGHSMGGKVAMWLALHRPELVSAVISADIAPVPYPNTLLAYVHAMKAVDLSRHQRRAEVEAALAGTVPEAGIRSFLMQNLVAEDGMLRWRINLDAIERNFDDITGYPVTDRVYDGPALFLDGEHSPYIRPEHGPAIRRLFPQARIETIRGAGHWLHAEKPDQVLDAVSRFLEG